MAKKSKLATPDWIKEGYDSKADWEKANGLKNEEDKDKKIPKKSEKNKTKKNSGKTFKIRICPKCGGDVEIVLSNMDFEEESDTGREWKCIKCDWRGEDVEEKILDEEEFLKYLDEKGEEVA
jgi:hypothetical protein